MEAATPLRKPQVRTAGEHLLVDGLIVADECAVRLVREREEAGEDALRTVTDAIEIGARVLDREQTGANAEFVKTEFEKVSREVEAAFSEKAAQAGELLQARLDETFSPDSGALTKELERLFSDGSSTAVQNRVRELVTEVMAKSREDLLRQFSSADGQNPLADFKAGAVGALKQLADRQDESLRALLEKMVALEKELQGLRDEKGKLEELEAERERGTAKGRSYEELVAEAIDAIAAGQGDDCDSVGDQKGATRKTGDIVVAIDACCGPARGRIVFEAKNAKLSKPEALRELDRGLAERDADFAVLVVAGEDKVPAKLRPLREYNGDKLVVTYDPDDDSPLALELAYALARARVLMASSAAEGVDAAAVGDTVDRALAAMDDVRRVKSQLTGATTQIDNAYTIVEEMAARVREHLRRVEELVSLP